MRLTVRQRLTAWNTLALAVLLLGLAGLVYGLQARALVAGVDRSLRSATGQLDRDVRVATDPGRLRYAIDELWEHERVACVVYAPDGSVLARTEELAADAVPPPPGPAGTGRFDSARLPVVGRQRLLTVPLPHATDGRTAVLMAGLAETDRTLAGLRATLLTAVPVMLAAAAVVAYGLAGRALAPVGAITRATNAITADALDRRLPVGNPHDELGRLSATVNAMIERLERSFAETRRFTADASHELRTPLAVLRAEIETSLARPLGPGEQEALVGSLLEECDRLGRLIDQLLTLARQDAGGTVKRTERVAVGELVRGVAETLRPLAEAKGLALTVEVAAPPGADAVRGDPAELPRAFVNVLDNAVKYTAAGSVTVRVTVSGDAVSVAVRDTGEGIPEGDLPRVFDRFYRVDKARSRELGGTGLGLSIARGVVAAHGGTIELSSTVGAGTVCTITLPRDTGAPT